MTGQTKNKIIVIINQINLLKILTKQMVLIIQQKSPHNLQNHQLNLNFSQIFLISLEYRNKINKNYLRHNKNQKAKVLFNHLQEIIITGILLMPLQAQTIQVLETSFLQDEIVE